MNTQRAINGFSESTANFVDFNADCSHFVVACIDGFKLYSSDTCDLYMQQELDENVHTASMLGTSNILGLTLNEEGGSRKLVFYDAIKRAEVGSITTTSNIIRCHLSKQHLAIVCERSLNLYRRRPSTEKVASYETVPNLLGLCCLGSKYLVFPGRTQGQIQVVELSKLRVTIVPAHTSSLRAIALGRNENLIASASWKGTLVRLHATADSARLGELRRGIASALILSLAISPSGNCLALTSDTNTLHVFNLPRRLDEDGINPRLRTSPSRLSEGSVSSQTNNSSYFSVQKWGSLARMPFAPRIFSDVYSFAAATCNLPEEEVVLPTAAKHQDAGDFLAISMPTIRPRGIVGWVDDVTLVVISAGTQARYERFALEVDDTGSTICKREGWSRFMRPN